MSVNCIVLFIFTDICQCQWTQYETPIWPDIDIRMSQDLTRPHLITVYEIFPTVLKRTQLAEGIQYCPELLFIPGKQYLVDSDTHPWETMKE